MQSRSAWKSFLVKNIRILLVISLLSLSIWQIALAFHPRMDVLFTGEDGCWYTKANMPSARRALSAVELGGMIYVIGGRDGDQYDVMERYNPATNSWQTLAPMPTARAWLVSAAVNGKIYAIGGNDGGVKLNTVEEYNPATNSWATKAPMPTARDDAAVGVVQGKIYVMGGWSTGALTVVEAYDPATNSWQARSPMPSPVAMTTGAVVNDKIYVIGGRDNTSDLSHNYMYDPLLNSWQVRASLPDARSRLASGVSNGKIIVIGGYNLGQGWLSMVESYDPLLNNWETLNSMPTPRGDIAAATVSDDIFVFGGRSGFDSQVLSTNEAVDFSCTDDPPNEPANPSPGWGWTNRRLDVDLSWTGSDPNPGDSLTYDVYFGEGLTPQLVSSDQTLTTYDLPKFLEPGMDYSWRVAARDNHGVVTSGPRWTFQTSGILNMLANWSFEVDLNNWVLGVNPLAQASASYDPSTSTKGSASARVDVVDSQNRLRRVQFVQNDLEFIQDKSYSLTFWAKSSIARPIAVVFRESVPPYTNFNTTTLDITTQWARYEVNLVSPDNYTPATMEFSLGGHVSSVWIDGVRLIETPAVMNASPSPSSIPSPGGAVTFNVHVENISLEPAMITALEDLDIGDITNPGNPAIITTNCNDGIVVGPSSHYTCQYQTMVSGTPGVLPRMLSASIDAGGTNVKIFDDANLTISVTIVKMYLPTVQK